MAIQHQTTVKSWFETGDKPTQAQFADWIESSMPEWQIDAANKAAGGATGIVEILSAVSATTHSPGAFGFKMLGAATTAAGQNALDLQTFVSGIVGGSQAAWQTATDSAVSALGAQAGNTGTLLQINTSASITLVSGRADPRDRTIWAALDTNNTATQNRDALIAAISAADALGGCPINLPRGIFLMLSGVTAASNATWIRGQGNYAGGTVLQCMSTTGNFITIQNGGNIRVSDLWLTSGVNRTADYAIYIRQYAFWPKVDNIRIDYHYNGIGIDDSSNAIIRDITFRYMLGSRGIHMYGSTTGIYGVSINNIGADNPYPYMGPSPGTVIAYPTSAATSVAIGKSTNVNSAFWQASQGGTTAGGNGPVGPPGSTGGDAFTTTVADGTVLWKWVSRSDLYWIAQDSRAYSIRINRADVINGAVGFIMADGANTGTSYPKWAYINQLEVDHPWTYGVLLNAGDGVYLTDSWIGSCLQGPGVLYGTSFRGESIVRGCRIVGNGTYGVSIPAGPMGIHIDNNFIGANSQANANAYDAVIVGTSAMRFHITNNQIGGMPDAYWGAHSFAIRVLLGASDYYAIHGNIMEDYDVSQTSTGLSNNATGTHKILFGASVTAQNAGRV